MSSDNSWIKLHRRLLNWRWYTDANVYRVFTHLLMSVNYKDNQWSNITVEAGQIATSIDNLATALRLSPKQIKLALKKLKSTNEIKVKGANRYSLITVCEWAYYQGLTNDNNSENCKTGTSKVPTKDHQRYQQKTIKGTTIKEDNNIRIKEVKNKNILSRQHDDVVLIFNHWKSVTKHSRSKMDAKRQRTINAALKMGYTVADLKQAIDGVIRSPFHQGNNERKTVYDSLELILKNAGQIDKFIQLSESLTESEKIAAVFEVDFENIKTIGIQ